MSRISKLSIFILFIFFGNLCFAQDNTNFRIFGRIPATSDQRLFQIQVGAFLQESNAQRAYERLRQAALNPVFERFNNLTRVMVTGINAREIMDYIDIIRLAGFDEVLIREDRNQTLRAPVRENLTEDVQNIIPQDIFNLIEEFGIEIHEGRNPPNIEGTYLITPAILVKSNFLDYLSPGYQFGDIQMTFSDQDNENLTVVLDYIQGEQIGNGLGSFITGNGNKFTVFTEVSGTHFGEPFKSVEIQSGEITPSGIINYYHLMIVTVETLTTIRRGQGRLIYNSEGYSHRIR